MALIARPAYLDWLARWRDRDVTKVLTGVRRCGKSTILAMFRALLTDQGVPPAAIISVNLEEPEAEAAYGSGLALYHHVKALTEGLERAYVFIDEAQHLTELERTVAGLALLPGVDLYLTGSNSEFLSRDLATRLTGRHVEIHVLPLSYREWSQSGSPDDRDWARYRRHGGLPFVASLDDEPMIRQYVSSVVDTIVLRDVAPRQVQFSAGLFSHVLGFMADNIGNPANVKRISDTLTSKGKRVSRPAVDRYVDALQDCYLFYRAPRFDLKGKALLENTAKYYVVDPGVRWALLGRSDADAGRLLENIVYLELRRRHSDVFVGRLGTREIDFVAQNGDDRLYVQVSLRVDDPAVLERELAPLRAVRDHWPRLLLVDDDELPATYDGIRRTSLRDWLLADSEPALVRP